MQQPNVSRKAHDRACDDQINQCEPGLHETACAWKLLNSYASVKQCSAHEVKEMAC